LDKSAEANDYTVSDDDVAQWLYRFWQYKDYADIRSGSQDLCKFSLDFMRASLYYVCSKTARRRRFQLQVFVYDS